MKKLAILFALFVILVSCDNMVQTNYYPDNMKESEGRISENNKTGEWSYWDKYGNLIKTEFYFETGEMDCVREFYINGEMKFIKYFDKGKPRDEWTFWDKEGAVIKKEFYENGKLIKKDE
jgi:antitoxin component YwqK of YwqJK toxin-antitoxin module